MLLLEEWRGANIRLEMANSSVQTEKFPEGQIVKEGSCQNEKSLVNICKHQYTVSEGCAKKLFKTIFNEDSDVHNVGSNCCKQLFHKEGRLCHDTFVSEIIKESPYNKRKSFYIERSANAWKSCVNSTIMSD
ncbi:hypothetical protein ACFE04_004540 [Oxalis oulophora]